MVDFVVVPARMALINIDMQNCFVAGYPMSAPDGLKVLDHINRLAAICREAGILVIHTSHVLRADGSNMGILGEVVPEIRGGFLNKGAASSALYKGLVVEPGDVLLEKPRYGAFHGTDLELILRSHGIDTVIIAGITTNVCCETTAREAMARDFRVMFLSDGTTTSRPGAQEMTFATIAARFGQVLTVEELVQKIQQAVSVVGKV